MHKSGAGRGCARPPDRSLADALPVVMKVLHRAAGRGPGDDEGIASPLLDGAQHGDRRIGQMHRRSVVVAVSVDRHGARRVEETIGDVGVFVSGGPALARIVNSVTDADYSGTSCLETDLRLDADYSFRRVSTEVG